MSKLAHFSTSTKPYFTKGSYTGKEIENARYSREFLRKLPKVDLHCHLDGSVRVQTIYELSKLRNITLPKFNTSHEPSIEDIRKSVELTEECSSLEEFLLAFDFTLAVMQKKQDIQRIFKEVAEDFAIQGTKYLEVRFCPTLHTKEGLTEREVLESVVEASEWVSSQFGKPYITPNGVEFSYPMTRVIVCGLRSFGVEHTHNMAKLTAEFAKQSDQVVAFDIAGAEKNFPPKNYMDSFKLIKDNNIYLTIHAGEGTGWKYIEEAIECGVDRIGHGIDLHQNDELAEIVKQKQIPLEICVTSNEFTKSYSLEQSPVRKYFDMGIPIVPCTDDVTMIQTDLTEEYYKITNTFNFTPKEIIDMIERSFQCAFLPESLRNNLASISKVEATQHFENSGFTV